MAGAGCLFLVLGCGESGGALVAGNSAELHAALEQARPGDTITLHEGTFDGAFAVPAGVSLTGAGEGLTEVVGPSDSAGLVLEGAGGTSEIAAMTVRATGHFAIVARDREVTLRNVTVQVDLGAGVGVEGGGVEMFGVNVRGTVTADNADAQPADPQPSDVSTHGVVLVRAEAGGNGLEVSGFASVGLMAVQSTADLTSVEVHTNLGTGVLVAGGQMVLAEAGIEDTLQGTRLIPAYNLVTAEGAVFSSTNLRLSRSGGPGALHAGGGEVRHEGLEAEGNAGAAVWAQGIDQIAVLGSALADNELAGLVLHDVTLSEVSDTTIDATRIRTRVIGVGAVEFGDGIQLRAESGGLVMERVTLRDNGRVGLLVDVGAAASGAVSVSDSTVGGSGEQLGAVWQGAPAPPGWDEAVLREGATVANDAAWDGALDIVDVVGPSDFESGADVAASGLAGVVGPSD